MATVKTIPLFDPGQRRASALLTGGDLQKKMLAEMLSGSNEPSHVWSNTAGALNVGSKLLGAFLAKRLAGQEQAEDEQAWGQLRNMLEQQAAGFDQDTVSRPDAFSSSQPTSASPSAASSGGRSGGGSRALAATERKQRALSRLTEKGYSPHAAQGIVDNLLDESGLNTGAVGDSGTAFGLAQWRGPRFENLKKFAASQGKDWRDFDTQVDFVDYEMRNRLDPGAGVAFAKLQAARDPNEAYNAFVQHYERPHRTHLARRLRPVGAPAAEPQTAYASGQVDDLSDPSTGAQGIGLRRPRTAMPQIPQPDVGQERMMMRQGLALMSSPRTREQGWQMYQAGMLGIRQKQAEYAKALREMQMEEGKRSFELEKMELGSELKRREPYTLPPGSARYEGAEKIVEQPKADGADIEVGADGSVRVKTGKLTEQQSKDLGFFDRGAGAEIELREREDALVDFMSKSTGNLPLIGNYMKSPEYQQAEVPAREFLAAVLRKDTGAAVTDKEFEMYGAIYLPQPGDDQETMRLKRAARSRALKAIKKGLGPAEALAESYPELFDGKSLEPKPKKSGVDGGKKEAMGGYRIGEIVGDYRYTGGDPTKRENWEKIEWN